MTSFVPGVYSGDLEPELAKMEAPGAGRESHGGVKLMTFGMIEGVSYGKQVEIEKPYNLILHLKPNAKGRENAGKHDGVRKGNKQLPSGKFWAEAEAGSKKGGAPRSKTPVGCFSFPT